MRRRIQDGLWHRVGRAVVLSPPHLQEVWSDTALSWILHVTFGPQARISGVLALRRARWQLPCDRHIVVLQDKPGHSIAGVTVLRQCEPAAAAPGVQPRFVAPRDALIDCLTVLSEPAAVDVLDAALQKRYVRPADVAEDVDARLGRGRRNAAGLRRLRDRALSGSRSEAEHRMARLLQRTACGPWVANHPICGPEGRVIAELDFAHLGARVAIEVDGRAFHSSRRAFENDRWRQNAISVGGWPVMSRTPGGPRL